MGFSSWGRYLGLAIGPGKHEHSWDAALPKYLQRACSWGNHHLGLQFSAAVYNTYVATVLSHIWQLETLPLTFKDFEHKAFRKLASGPGNWILPNDLHFVKELYGQARSFVDATAASLAARIRVYTWEASADGGLRAKHRAAHLLTTLRNSDLFERKARWRRWYEQSAVVNLSESINDFATATGTTVRRVLQELRTRHTTGGTTHLKAVKKEFQKAIYSRLMMARQPIGEDRYRQRLARWQLPGVPLRVARRALRQLKDLNRFVPPRISAAVLSTAWNRWCTDRRFQRPQERGCRLGCGAIEDSIEHYSRCRFVHSFASTFLCLDFPRARGLELFAFAFDSWSAEKDKVKASILIYAVYRVTETIRHDEGAFPEEVVVHMLQQACREAVKGHSGAMRILDNPR